MSAQSRDVVYRIDARARLAWVGETWERFARDNEAPWLTPSSVVGRSLWDFVEGIETRRLYETMFEKVRGEGTPVVVPFRCDSPGTRRFMELRIGLAASSSDELELAATLLRAEPRRAEPLLDATVPRSRKMLGICSFCKRVEVMAADWLEVDEAVSRLDLLAVPRLPNLSHGVCPDCAGRARELGGQGR